MAPAPVTVKAGPTLIELQGELGKFKASLQDRRLSDGRHVVTLDLQADRPAVPSPLHLKFTHPSIDIQALWSPASGRHKGFPPDWAGGFTSRATTHAPVLCLLSQNGSNRLTFACSDALNPVKLQAGLREETGSFVCRIELFSQHFPAVERYQAELLIDARDVHYSDALRAVQEWWSQMPAYRPARVPEAARQPMVSTWYSFHQSLTPEGIETQCRLGRRLGCRSVIVDDGWQTADSSRGYAWCGDWKVSPKRIPDMAAHVERVHRLGMKYLLWYSVPFMGRHSRAFRRFRKKFLRFEPWGGAGTLDPRYPEVREYLIGIYEQAVRDWGLDGFKLDFVDCLTAYNEQEAKMKPGMDLPSLDAASDRLLTDVMERLRRLNPDIMIEFRQSYTGPLMRKYGNMFRAGDCPNEGMENRIKINDLRLISGDTAVHSDMLMWRPDEPVESAALQLLNVLFSVPQISVLLDRLPEDHGRMLTFWLRFWREHRDALLLGDYLPLHPESNYPVVIGSAGAQRVVAVYDDAVVDPGPDVPAELDIVNGKRTSGVALRLKRTLGTRRLEIYDCTGKRVLTKPVRFKAGLHDLPVPPAGLAVIH